MRVGRKRQNPRSGLIARVMVVLMILSITAGSRRLVCVGTPVGQIPAGPLAAASDHDHQHAVEFTHFHQNESGNAGEPGCRPDQEPLNHLHVLDAIAPVVLPGNLMTLATWKPVLLATLLQPPVLGFVDPITFLFVHHIACSETATQPLSAFATMLRPSVILQV